MYQKILFTATGAVGLLYTCNVRPASGEERKPNVIVIMSDDQGYGELSLHGNPIIRTPNLDSLGRKSIRFNDFHTAPMSTPTRGQLMTGIHAVRNGAVNVSSGRTLLCRDIPTMADYFSGNGYNTGIFGKWHLGDNYPYTPQFRGFKESVWFPSSHIGSAPDYWGNDYFDDTYIHNGSREKYKGYCTDVFFSEAMKFIKSSVKQDKSFFIYLPTNTPHGPSNVSDDDIKAVEKMYDESPFAGTAAGRKNAPIRYLAMIHNLDVNIGRLREFLKKENLDRNTVIVFLTDNGSTHAPSYYPAGMRGNKTQLWEGGHRVPLFIHYPEGRFTEPRVVNGLSHVQDILPTLIDLCRLKKVSDVKMDGMSLLPYLRTRSDIPDDRMIVINFSRFPGFDYPSPYSSSIVRKEGAAVCWKRWRLLENRELYNLDEDPMQTTNVIANHPDVASKMRDHLDKWWESVADVANMPQRVIIGSSYENPVMLTPCEWLDVHFDQQDQVRSGSRKNSYWLLEAEVSGLYEFELRRWPRELNIPLSDTLPRTKRIPIANAKINVFCNSVSGNLVVTTIITKSSAVNPEDHSAVFQVEIGKGNLTLHTFFTDKDQLPLCGAYYVYVKKL